MSTETRKILAIDQSTSATKAIIFDTQGRLLDRFSLGHQQIYPRPGWVEHDAEELWRNTQSVIQLATAKHQNLACVSITNQRETFVIIDRATGRPLHNAVVWQCRRGDGVCARMIKAGRAELISSKTGLKIDSYFSAPKLAALLEENPDFRCRLQTGEAMIGTIDAFLLYRLTGGRVFATDTTNASRTLLFNISTLTWDAELCDLFQIPINALPEVRDSTSRFGLCDPSVVGVDLPIVGMMGDSQAALFAHRCFQPGQAKVTIGTGSSILLNTGSYLPQAGIRTLAWTHGRVPTYCLEGIISYSAATIAWLRDQLGLIKSADETEVAARAVPDNGGVYLVPAFTGLSAPHWSPNARAAIVGLSAGSTRNHVLRAALESIAYQIKDALDSMRSDGRIALLSLHADGGATRNRFLTQFIADVLGTELIVANAADFSPLGAAMAAMLGMGIYASIEQLHTLQSEAHVLAPSMSRSTAKSLHTAWSIAVQQVLACAGIESGCK